LLGAILNYDVSAQSIGGRSQIGGVFEGLISRENKYALTNFVASSGGGARRLETTIALDDPTARRGVRIGDAISSGGAWGLPVRYGGVRFASDFTLDPTFISYPSPRLGGAAALPATVDVYVDNALRRSDAVAPGPFEIAEPPALLGAGEARVIVTDMLGRQSESAQKIYVSPRMLRPGLADFALDAGVLRRRFGAASDDYADGFAAATYRRGLSDRLTGQAHGETSGGAGAFGVALTHASYALGQFDAALAASAAQGKSGALARLGWSRISSSWSAAGSYEVASKDFWRLGEAPGAETRRASFSLGWRDRWGGDAALGIVSAYDADGARTRVWNAAYSYPITERVALTSTLLRVDQPETETIVSVGVSALFGPRTSGALQMESGADGPLYRARLQQAIADEDGFGWRLAAETGAQSRLDAALVARAPFAEGEADFSRAGETSGARLSARGALSLLRGRLAWSRPLRGAFALVEAAPGMDVLLDHRVVGRADLRGRFVVPDLRAHQINLLAINPEQAPLAARVGADAARAKPGARSGAYVHFAVAPEEGRWVRILAADGAPAPQGLVLTRAADGAQFFVQENGRAYVARRADAHVLIAAVAGRPCAVDLAARADVLTCAPQS
jgi:outer membrane usher protein